MTATTIESAKTGNTQIILDAAAPASQGSRISIFDATATAKVIMGYLDDVPRNYASGTSTAGTDLILTDTAKELKTNDAGLIGTELYITGGPRSGENQTIASNTATTITVDIAFTGAIGAGATYEVRYGDADYGFWAKAGDHLRIDGDVTYENGDWLIQHDASVKILDGANDEILRLGTYNAKKGLFLSDDDMVTTLAEYTGTGLTINSGGDITLAGHATQPGQIIFDGAKNFYMASNAGGTTWSHWPEDTGTGAYNVGWKQAVGEGGSLHPFNTITMSADAEIQINMDAGDPTSVIDLDSSYATLAMSFAGGLGGALVRCDAHDITTSEVTIWTSGGVQVTVDENGHFGIGMATPDEEHLYVKDATVDTTTDFYGIRNDHTKTAGATTNADDFYGIHNYTRMNHNGSTIGYLTGIYNETVLSDGTLGPANELEGIYAVVQITGGTVGDNMVGHTSWLKLNAGTVSGDVIGHRVVVDIDNGMTNVGGDVYGEYIEVDDDQGAVGTVYGLYINDLTNVDFGIYQNGIADNYFAGPVGIGTPGPGSLLHLNTTTATSVTLLTLESDVNNANEYNEILFKVTGGKDYGAIRSYVGAAANDSYMSFLTTTDGSTLVQHMTIQHDGKVGIGTSGPDELLHIESATSSDILIKNTGATSTTIYGDAARTGAGEAVLDIRGLWNGNNAAGIFFMTGSDDINEDEGRIQFRTSRAGGDFGDNAIAMTIDELGNVGIGETSPDKKLVVEGNIRNNRISMRDNAIEEFYTNANAEIGISYNGYDDGTTQFRDFSVYDGKRNSIMFVDGSAGNVGIGTTGPAARLEVETTNGQNISGVLIDHNEVTGNFPALEVDSEMIDTNSVVFRGKLVLYCSQDVANGRGLYVERNIAEAGSSPLVSIVCEHASNIHTALYVRQDGTGDIVNFWDGAVEVFTILNGGNVGIGTTGPSDPLTVEGVIPVNIRRDMGIEGAATGLKFSLKNDGDNWHTYSQIYGTIQSNEDGNEGGQLKFYTSRIADGILIERVVIDENGNVGIGTTGPGQILDVNSGSGNMIADGYDNHPSFFSYKENIEEATYNLSDAFSQIKLYKFKKKPFVSADELKIATIKEFGQEKWDSIYPDENSYRHEALYTCPDAEMLQFLNSTAEELRVDRRGLAKWDRWFYDIVVDDPSVQQFSDLLFYDDKGGVAGISRTNHIGLLHMVLKENVDEVSILKQKVQHLETEVETLKTYH